jgi:hypothetical protein
MKNSMHSYTLNLFNENRLVFINENQKTSTEKQEPKDAINKLNPEEAKKTIETATKKLQEFSKDITTQLEKKPNDPKLKATQNYFNNLLENLRNALKNKSNIPAVNIAKNIIRVLDKIEREEMEAVDKEMKAISEGIGSKEKYDKKMEANFQELLSQFKNLPTGKEVGFKMKNSKEVTVRKINKDTCQLQYKDGGKITISLKDPAGLLNVAQTVADNLEFTNPHAYQELAQDFKLEKTNINNWAGTGGKQTEELKLIYGIGEYDNKSSVMKDKEGNEFYFKLSGKNGEATTMELYIKNKDTKEFKLALKEVNGKIEKPANGPTAVAQQPKKIPLDINNPDF